VGADGSVVHHKVPSTPDDPARAVLAALDAGGPRSGPVVHGSTVATNALLERKLARTALVTTRGFADLLELARQNRESLYDLFQTRPEPIVPRSLRFEASERTDADGRVLDVLDDDEIARVVASVHAAEGVGSVAVMFLHAYANEANERRMGDALEAAGFSVSLSHRVLNEYREFERLSTTVVNAALVPIMSAYLARLSSFIPGDRLRIMQSNGGSSSPPVAASEPVRTVL